MPQDRIIDGHDVSEILLGKTKAKSPHETLYYEKDGVRQGKWKLVRYKVKADRFAELYDLEKDLGEQNDLSKQYPEKVKALSEALDAHVSKIESEIDRQVWSRTQNLCLRTRKGCPLCLNGVASAPSQTKRRAYVYRRFGLRGHRAFWFKDQQDATPGQDGSGGA